jgi:hypothetical protein
MGQLLRSAAVALLTVAFSPLIVVAGEPLRRYVLAGPRAARPAQPGWYRALKPPRPGGRAARVSSGPAGTLIVFSRRHSFWMLLVSNPVWIALTAPARWLLDRASGFGHQGRGTPPAAGVREPRRPKPRPPGGSVALAEPRTEPVLVRLIGTALRGLGHPGDREGLSRWSRRRGARGRPRHDPTG